MTEYIAMGIGLTIGFYIVNLGLQAMAMIVEIIIYELRRRNVL